jgi:hypothetical protein
MLYTATHSKRGQPLSYNGCVRNPERRGKEGEVKAQNGNITELPIPELASNVQ